MKMNGKGEWNKRKGLSPAAMGVVFGMK